MSILSDYNINDSSTINNLTYKPRELIQREFMTDDEILANVGKDLFVDIELYPNYYLCSFKLHGTNKFICLESGNEKKFNPHFLAWLMNNYRTIGFNSIKYDLLIIWLSYVNQFTPNLKNLSNDIIDGYRLKELKERYAFYIPKTPHIDLIEVAPLKGSLKLYGARLHSPRIQELPFPDYEELTSEQIEIVKQYNFNDLDVTEQLFDFMKERLELRQSMSIEYKEDLMSKSDAQIAEVVLSKEVTKLNGKRPIRPIIKAGTVYKYAVPSYINYFSDSLNVILDKIKKANFVVNEFGKIVLPEELKTHVTIGSNTYRIGIGGLHSSEKCISHIATDDISIVDRDVASYYPRIITTLGLYPTAMGKAFLEAYNKIIERRLDAKKKKIFTTDKGLKIVINGTSGKFSDEWSCLYSPDLTIQVTITGQLALLMLIEWLYWCGIEVISANTDGIVMLLKKNQEKIYLECIKQWEMKTGFETEETKYAAYHARDVNSYFAVKLGNTVKMKGPYSEIGSQSGTQLDTNPNALICTDAIVALLSKGIPIEETIKSSKDFTRFVTVRQVKGGAKKDKEYLGKVIRWAYIKKEYNCIKYVTNGHKVPDTDGAVPFMDLPTQWPDINYDWYINKTKEILYEIGFTPRPKQLTFFEGCLATP
jgi:hypothetical protein